MVRLAVMGAAGRMGAGLVRLAGLAEEIRLVAAIEKADSPFVGRDSGVVAGAGENGVAITPDNGDLRGAEVMIDFTFHEAAPGHIAAALRQRAAVVLGTTGLTKAEEETVKAAVDRIPVLWAPNMSLGMNLLFGMVERAAAVLGPEYDIEIVEMHHHNKKDAPSGTALRLGEAAAAGRKTKLAQVVKHGREGIPGARPAGEIGMHAVRGGDVVGDHDVMFAADGEILRLSHRATNRDAFVKGAIQAAKWVVRQRPGLYDMMDMLALRTGR
jgi:4-hydroxy-tetrahydrodipicolinate reductase